MAELTQNEKRLLALLEKEKKADAPHLASLLDTTPEAIVQWAHLAEDTGLATVERLVAKEFVYTDEGKTYAKNGLPETQLFRFILPGTTLADLQKHEAFRIGFGQLRKKGLVKVDGSSVVKIPGASTDADEAAFNNPSAADPRTKELIKRGILQESETVRYAIAITPSGLALAKKGLDLREETGTLTREQILTGAWKTANLRRYDVAKLPKRVYPGKTHPYQRLIEEMRQILLEMGFTEIYGDIVQSSFWNFDALFQPQDHPAREMQDTFYLNEEAPLPAGWEKVRDMHERGGETSSNGWGGTWDKKKAEQCVLRTHTTTLSIQHLAANPNPPVKAFCISRVYRREAIDPTHTPEFEQLEGIVMDKGVSFRHLLGYLKEFYGRMGFEDVRFRPAYFPYTEPSVEPEIYVDGLGWVEMGGAGIFREEVTAPWGITYPVLAWGLGVSRVAMLKLGLKDLRLLYRSDIEWIRESPVHREQKVTKGAK
ncbi:MAG TPA: phenylalanine--tRNA ligase subunit alpha [Methanoregula sp.]|nr:phenylalanine--tRNA ligase subunit alpha [Methanoregula sp.]